jgi:hypothetical protein
VIRLENAHETHRSTEHFVSVKNMKRASKTPRNLDIFATLSTFVNLKVAKVAREKRL